MRINVTAPEGRARAAALVPTEATLVALTTAFRTLRKAAPRQPFATRRPEFPRPAGLPRPAQDSACPVVLVSGYLSPLGCWDALLPRLHENGFRNTTCFAYDSLRADIPEIAEALAAQVSAVTRAGTPGVHLIGYSMGGLVARYAVQRLGLTGDPISVTTIATPHRGSPLACAGVGPAAQQMRVNSEFLRGLPAMYSSGRVRWSLIGSPTDRMVPLASATDGRHADSLSLAGGGHLGILDSPQMAGAVLSHLELCEFEQALVATCA
ncbi:esterase/lipase family protein [Streptomyces sp. CA-132043]|uniref:esterase/lipase family protein n=1 Tax=Streptomyces sp. CA-132043 TaxID=3240048 RepID=UPI003D90FCE3